MIADTTDNRIFGIPAISVSGAYGELFGLGFGETVTKTICRTMESIFSARERHCERSSQLVFASSQNVVAWVNDNEIAS